MSDKIHRSAVSDQDKNPIRKYQVEERKDDKLRRHAVIGIGGGSETTIIELNATENKIYTAPAGSAYNPVNVNVPASLPNEYLESEFDLLHSNSTLGFKDLVKNIGLATNKYNQFANGYITGRSAGVMMGYTNQGDIKRCVVKMGTFDRTVETQDQYQTLFKLVSGNNHFTIRYDNTNSWWLISDASGANIKILDTDLPKYSFDGANVEIVFGAKYINGELYKGIKQNNNITTDFSNHFFVYVNGELKIEAPNEAMTGDTLNTIGVFNIGGKSNTWIGACFENVKIYNVLNCYNKYYEEV
ncbi:hypothetical protein [Methanobrevibacter sp.]|uniref:hypothetical protein n=1 Tax=Methanobrevibacter sp. TaxID=66852 RepID=UPI00388EC072